MRTISYLLATLLLLFSLTGSAVSYSANNDASNQARLWNLQDADILSVINEVSLETGKNFVVDPRVSGKISLISSKPIQPDQVYDLFLSVLELLGYSAIQSGDVVKIVPNIESNELATPIASAKSPGRPDDVVVRVISLDNITAAQLIPIIRPMLPQWSNVSTYVPGNVIILMGRAGNLERIIKVIHNVDSASGSEISVIQLHRATATQVASVISNLQNASRAAGEIPLVSISADERGNRILLGGSKAARLRMAALVTELDTPNAGVQGNTEVIYLRYLQAKKFAPILGKIAQNILGKGDGNVSSGLSTSIGTSSFLTQQNNPSTRSSGKTAPEEPENKTLIQAEPNTNSLIITAPPGLMSALNTIISKLDIRPAQVLVEAVIVEIDENELNDFGIQWGELTSAASIANSNSDDGFPAEGLGRLGIIPGVDLKAVLSVLKNTSGVNVLSTPNIVVLDNQKATLAVGTNIGETSGSYATSAGTTTVTPFNTVSRADVVLKLDVIPQINLGNAVKLTLNLKNDSLQNPTDPGSNPVINTSQIKNSVLVNSSDVLVIGGLMSNKINDKIDKVPLLGDIPILGNVFTHKARTLEKKNLMVFLKPVIMHNENDLNNITLSKYDMTRNAQINWPEDLSEPGKQKLANILPPWKNHTVLPTPFGDPA
jgi:general secretion pathway protein D